MRPVFRTAATAMAAVVALPLLATGSHAAATPQTCTWTGGGGANNRFSVAANWRCTNGSIPAPNAALAFPTVASWATVVNDLPNSVYYRSITGATSTGGYHYTVSGNPVRMAGTLANVDIKAPVTLVNYLTVSDATIWGTVNVGRFPLTFKGYSGGIINGAVTGTGQITASAPYVTIAGANSNYTGRVVATTGRLEISASIPRSGVTANAGASLTLLGTTTLGESNLNGTSNPVTLIGPAFTHQGHSFSKLSLGDAGGGYGGGIPQPSQEFLGTYASPGTFTYAGRLTVQGNSPTINPARTTVNMTGTAVAKGFSLVPNPERNGTLKYTFTSNNSNTRNGTYAPTPRKITLNDARPTLNLAVSAPYQLTVNGTRSSAMIFGGPMASLRGNLAVAGEMRLSDSATLHPGGGYGTMTAGRLITWGGTVHIDVASAGTYSRLVAKEVILDNSTKLRFEGPSTMKPAIGTTFEIVRNTGTAPVRGIFYGLGEGAKLQRFGRTVAITYKGGTGNDIVFKVVA